MLPPLHSTSPHLSEESVCSSLRRSHQESQAQLVYSGDEFKDFSQVSDPKSTLVTVCLYIGDSLCLDLDRVMLYGADGGYVAPIRRTGGNGSALA